MKYHKIEVYEAEDGSIYRTENEIINHEINMAVGTLVGTSADTIRAAVADPKNADQGLVSAIATLNEVFMQAAIQIEPAADAQPGQVNPEPAPAA